MLEAQEFARRLNRHKTFWKNKLDNEGIYISITAPDEGALELSRSAESLVDLEKKWFDIEYRVNEYERQLGATYYAGDAVPLVNIDFGPGVLAAMLGAQYRLAENTVWFGINPIADSWEDIDNLKLDAEGKVYKTLMELTERMCEKADNRYIVGIADIGVNLDVLASLLNREELLLDVLRDPAKVKKMIGKIDGFWQKVLDENYKIIKRYMKGVTSWVPLVNENKWYPLLSEFSVMVSPTVFQEIIFPALQWEVDHLEQALFNLDGEDQIKHLPKILQLKGLHSIEWDPVPQYSSASKKVTKDFASKVSLEVYREIQKAGKKVVINGVAPDQLDTILSNISPDGVFFVVSCTSRKEADETLAYTSNWIKG